MNNSYNNIKGHLYIPKSIVIKNDLILAKKSKNCNYYLPFNTYSTDDKNQNNIHIIFANLNFQDNKEITNFCCNYGLLGLYESKNFDIDKYTEENLDYFRTECKHFQFVMALSSAVNARDSSKIIEIYKKYNHSMTNTTDKYGNKISDTNEDILNGARGIILASIDERLENSVHPFLPLIHINNDFPKEFSWRCDSLISSIYMMLALDITHGFINKRCEFCGNFFTPTRLNAIYCSPLCQKAAKQKRHRRRIKLKKLWNEGKTKNEIISKLVDVEENQIDIWINEFQLKGVD